MKRVELVRETETEPDPPACGEGKFPRAPAERNEVTPAELHEAPFLACPP